MSFFRGVKQPQEYGAYPGDRLRYIERGREF